MTADRIRAILANSYMMFVFDFADPTQVKLEYDRSLDDLFGSQKSADRAKKILGKEGFKKAVAVYFSKFQNARGVNYDGLDEHIKKSKKVIVRHLGKDKVQLLELIIMVSRSIEDRKGLLGMAI